MNDEIMKSSLTFVFSIFFFIVNARKANGIYGSRVFAHSLISYNIKTTVSSTIESTLKVILSDNVGNMLKV
jgi:hypothetical protein